MDAILDIFLTLDNNVFIYGMLILMLLLSLWYTGAKERSFTREKVETFEMLTGLTDEALIVFSGRKKVLFVSHAMQKLAEPKKSRHKNSLMVPKLPLLVKKGVREVSFDSIVDNYLRRSYNQSELVSDLSLNINGEETPISMRLNTLFVSRGKKHAYVVIKVVQAGDESDMSKMHYLHPVSGLPNHHKASADISLLKGKMQLARKKFAVVAIGLDNFAALTSALGYRQSQSILSTIAKFFHAISNELNLAMYHMPNDNFLIIAQDIESNRDIDSIINKLKSDIHKLYEMNKVSLHLSFSSGVSIYPDNKMTNLLDSAYHALALAHGQGEGYIMYANESQGDNKSDELELVNEIKQAIEKNQFMLYYQPIVDAKTHEVVSAESLIRWQHPTRGLVFPDEFIPIAEKTGLVIDIGKYTMAQAIRQLAQWDLLGMKKIQLSVNSSLRELESDGYAGYIESLLKKHSVDPTQLKVEITENAAMTNEDDANRQFDKIRDLGIQISLDDFGVGHSSFAFLGSLPIDFVKIDKSFILDLATNKDHQSITKAMITMNHILGLKVIAEGIENKTSANLLNAYECDYLQGYYFSRPVPVFEFQQYLKPSAKTAEKSYENSNTSTSSSDDDDTFLEIISP